MSADREFENASYQNRSGGNTPPNVQQDIPSCPPPPDQPYPIGQLPMPGSVRTARVFAYAAAALAVLGSVFAALLSGPVAAGAVLGSQVPVIGVIICALHLASAGPRTRVTAIVCASFMILFGLGALGHGNPAGIVQLGLGGAIVTALSQRQSGEWFRRPRN
ncbi:hypothetical protein [Streptomyces sp. NPDC015125]|uniref:hypothetical protein n=1 Tax=Streptomyces sp. NPDC015125 TaxID=3364938 RepID=UPI0036F686DA